MIASSIFWFNCCALIKKPSLVFCYFSKMIKKLIESKDNHLINCILKRIGEKKSDVQKCELSSGTLKVILQDQAYKIGVSKNIQSEFYRYIQIKKRYPLLESYLPEAELYRKGLWTYIKMPRYFFMNESEIIIFSKKLLSIFREYGEKRTCHVQMFQDIQQGIVLCHYLFGKSFSDKLHQRVKEIFSVPWVLGPVHGDFHLGNMLKSKKGLPVLIDMDNFFEKNIQALDALTVLIDIVTTRTSKRWQEAFKEIIYQNIQNEELNTFYSFFDNEIRNVGALYLLNRLGYENKYYSFLSKSVQKEFSILRELIDGY